MTPSHLTCTQLLLGIAAAALLAAGTVATWALPRPTTNTRPAPQNSRADDPCAWLIAPAREACLQETTGASAPGGADGLDRWRGWPLLFSATAGAGAVGLAVMTGRQDR